MKSSITGKLAVLLLVMALPLAGCETRPLPTAKSEPSGSDDPKPTQKDESQPGSEAEQAGDKGEQTEGEGSEQDKQAKTEAAPKTAESSPEETAEKEDATAKAGSAESSESGKQPEAARKESETVAGEKKTGKQKPQPADGELPELGSKEHIEHILTSGGDWPQWGGTPHRNNVPTAKNVPKNWHPGDFDFKTGKWQPEEAKKIKWVARLGSQTYGNPVVADGRIYVGTNNGAGYLERYPSDVDLGCLLCFRESDGKFLWQHSSEKLPTGRVHDWPLQGICCAPLVHGKRLWFVTSRGEVRCLDTEGFYDEENDGPYKDEVREDKEEADVIWVFDMMKELGVSQHNMCSCSVTAAGDLLFVNTSNGLDESHINLPAPDAPSFICLDLNTGELIWQDDSPGTNILHGQWSSPTYGVLGDVPQVIFGGGDGWVYSFRGDRGTDGKPELLWKFDANPKTSKWILGGSGTRNNIIATPVISEGLVYVAVGQDPEHGEGEGHLWCLDPTKRGDVSAEIAYNVNDLETPIPHKRIQAVIPEENEVARPNPNSAVLWHYSKFDQNGDGEIDFEEEMHRSCGTVAIKDDILYISDFSGLFHCLDAKTGKVHWTYDMLAVAWGSPLIVDGHVYIGDEDGDVSVFRLSGDRAEAMRQEDPDDPDSEWLPLAEINMGNSVYSTPIVANGVLYISNKTHLFAIAAEEGVAGAKAADSGKDEQSATEAASK